MFRFTLKNIKPINMRYLSLLFIALLALGCSKDKFNPDNPKNGQIVELFVDHYSAYGSSTLFVLPKNEASSLNLRGFDQRNLGYTYKVKARFVIEKQPPMDGADRWFDFIEVISKERYTNTAPFEISLKFHDLFGTALALGKENNDFKYMGYTLKPENEAAKKQLEDIYLLKTKFQQDIEYSRLNDVKAVVTHDPANWEKGYLVRSVRIEGLKK